MRDTRDFDNEARRLTKELRASAERFRLGGSSPDPGPGPAEHRGRRTAIEFLSAGVLAVGVIAIILALSGHAVQTSKTTRPTPPAIVPPPTQPVVVSPPTPSALSAGKFIMDLTWVNDQTGWALSAAECASGLCPELASTTDGGKTWHPLPNPPASIQNGTVNCDAVACIVHVRFATTTVGYLYGPALLVTSDGGRSWQREQSLPVEALEPTHGRVYRIVYDHTGCPGPCDRTLETAPDGSTTWRKVMTIPVTITSNPSAALVLQGSQTIYIPIYGNLAAGAGTQQAIIFRSLDAGRTWRQLSDPCGGSGTTVNDAVGFTAAAPSFAATLCSPRSGPNDGSGEFIVTSDNAGTSWGPPHPAPGLPEVIAAASPTHLALATGPITGSGSVTYTLYVSTDGGSNWTLAVSDPEVLDPAGPGSAYLGFEDSLFGRWVGFEGAIWTTEDGGTHWSRRPFP
jgi:photosystem II stability/assembly factor-like uncharacterized protein